MKTCIEPRVLLHLADGPSNFCSLVLVGEELPYPLIHNYKVLPLRYIIVQYNVEIVVLCHILGYLEHLVGLTQQIIVDFAWNFLPEVLFFLGVIAYMILLIPLVRAATPAYSFQESSHFLLSK